LIASVTGVPAGTTFLNSVEHAIWKKKAVLSEEDYSKLASEFDLSLEDAKNIIKVMDHHMQRKEVENAVRNHYEKDVLGNLKELGVNTNFREPEIVPNAPLEEMYYPKLFNDDELAEVTEELKKKLIKETKASLQIDVEYEEYAKKMKLTDYTPPAIENTTADENVPAAKPLRHKIAFVDLSQPAHIRKTTIVTRSGK